MEPRVFLCVNSDIGRGNTIGTRFERIAAHLERDHIPFTLVARAAYGCVLPVIVPWYKNVPGRAINAARMYLFPGFDARAWEIAFFDRFVLRFLRRAMQDGAHYTVAHFGEFLPRSMAFLKARGVRVLLDMPIGYPIYGKALTAFPPEPVVRVTERTAYIDAALAQADTIIAPSRFVQETLAIAGFGHLPSVCIPFGVDMPKDTAGEGGTGDRVAAGAPQGTPQAAPPQGASARACTFLFVGSVNFRKGISFLLTAWQQMRRTNETLILCGRVFKEIRSLFDKDAGSGIERTGFVDPKPYYRGADVFVFPSLLEGSAKAVYEAMSYGLPVITTPNAGSIVEDGICGYIVPAGDARALKEKMELLAHDPALRERMGAAAQARAAKYPWERYTRAVEAVYLS